jgi:hypothetical protein
MGRLPEGGVGTNSFISQLKQLFNVQTRLTAFVIFPGWRSHLPEADW